jgi:hypothetical protein
VGQTSGKHILLPVDSQKLLFSFHYSVPCPPPRWEKKIFVAQRRDSGSGTWNLCGAEALHLQFCSPRSIIHPFAKGPPWRVRYRATLLPPRAALSPCHALRSSPRRPPLHAYAAPPAPPVVHLRLRRWRRLTVPPCRHPPPTSSMAGDANPSTPTLTQLWGHRPTVDIKSLTGNVLHHHLHLQRLSLDSRNPIRCMMNPYFVLRLFITHDASKRRGICAPNRRSATPRALASTARVTGTLHCWNDGTLRPSWYSPVARVH